MAETIIIPQKTPIGDLNSLYQSNNFSPVDYQTQNSIYFLRTAIQQFYEQQEIRRHDGSWHAYCIDSKISYTPNEKEYSVNSQIGETRACLLVKARIPELDAGIPFPQAFGWNAQLTRVIRRQISMHRTFYAYAPFKDIPKNGDTIVVDFEGGDHATGKGIYKEIKENTNSIIPDSSDVKVGSGKLANLFQDPKYASDINFLENISQPSELEEHAAFITSLANDARLLPIVVSAILSK
tara:strand:- start:1207 stop:1920 length:714 start_codon:yes stop_codon:yes gene_type:complete